MQIGRQCQALLRQCVSLSDARALEPLALVKHTSQAGLLRLPQLAKAPCSGQGLQLRAFSAAAGAPSGPLEASRGEELVVQARKNTQFWLRSSIIGATIHRSKSLPHR